jgi:hypothetical protein
MAKALYVAYFTGVAGQSIGLFYIGDGMLVGVVDGAIQHSDAALGASRHCDARGDIAPATRWNVTGLIHLSVKRAFDAEQVSRALVFERCT